MKFRRTVLPLAIAASISVLLPTRTYAGTPEQDAKNYTQTPSLEEYRPRSTLVTREHKIERARFPFIDIHSHHANPTAQHVDQLVGNVHDHAQVERVHFVGELMRVLCLRVLLMGVWCDEGMLRWL